VKKIDLHIHTKSTSSDSAFIFNIDRLKEYISNTHLDAIAVTNHNVFDIEQYKLIRDSIGIPVFPGIEIDLDDGHLLLIADISELNDFNSRCSVVTTKNIGPQKSISLPELIEIYHDLSKYILIPHYFKDPAINDRVLQELRNYISAGEVNNPKKFMYCKKTENSLVPVYFSDCRICSEFPGNSIHQTYINCGEISFGSIKGCLRDKNKVSLSLQEGHSLFQVFDNGQELSSGLNVIVGERSTGKSYTLDLINNEFPNIKYIKQFDLVEKNSEKDKENFNKLLSQNHSFVTQEYLKEFAPAVNDVMHINLEENANSVSDYLESLVKHAKESERRDAFASTKLFTEEKFQISNLDGLKELIASVRHLIENDEYRDIINKHVSSLDLRRLIVELMGKYQEKEEERLKKYWLNDLIDEIKNNLHMRSAATKIEEVDLYRIALENEKIKRFNVIVAMIRKERQIVNKDVQGFKIVARIKEFDSASDLKTQSGQKKSFSDAFKTYQRPYEYLKKLRDIDGLPEAEYFRYFAKIEYRILNKDGCEVSGGERSEFNLLREISDAQQYDMLLIDEPESSFDNLFLKKGVNNIIKEISKNTPVVLVTHNSTIGASIKPDYLLYTEKIIVDDKPVYRVYSGFPNDKELKSLDGKSIANIDVTLDCLEAGKSAYDERRRIYADLENP